MKAEALKLELIQWLAAVKDKSTLESLLFFKKLQQSSDWWDELSTEQREQIDVGLAEIKKGKTVSADKVWAKYGRKEKR